MTNLINQLQSLEDQVNAREESFLKHFVTGDTLLGLNGIWFGAENIKFYYISLDGMHVTDQIGWAEFNQWLANK